MTGRALGAWATVAVGMLVMVIAGGVAQRYTPFWFDPDEGCALYGRCVTEASEAALRALWWVAGVGLVVLLLGVAGTVSALPRARQRAPQVELSAPVQAAVAGTAGLVTGTVGGPLVVFAILVAAQAVPAVVCLLWLVDARLVAVLVGKTGPAQHGARFGWSTGLAAGALAVAVSAGLWSTGLAAGQWYLPAFAHGAALAVAVLVARLVAAPAGGRAGSASGLVGTLAVFGAVTFLAAVPEPPDPEPVGPPERHSAPPPVAAPSPAAPQTPDPTRPPAADVQAARVCAPGELTWSTAGWDAAMGGRWVTVVATSTAPVACSVDGFPRIDLRQGGRSLGLVVEPGSPIDPNVPVVARRVGIAPGGSASFVLHWRGYGAAADEDTPQTLVVALDGDRAWRDVPLSDGPAPFDLVDGATVVVGSWRAGAP
ncbi:DUF4232 domain-containing protein [Pseudonocardia nigra]|uniref:DUF4232 domain-containing protein n=1 Tax=Pseudonocardia nigra TaxID=1921578 RepID=UPI001C5F1664|nr:DUF4232 domain-containing protein [Pseudonocardia nigra]